jgi:hypothetical protein
MSAASLADWPLNPSLLGNFQSLLLAQTIGEVDGGGNDGIGVLGSDLLDVHATLGGGNEDRTFGGTIVQDGNVVLVCGIAPLSQHDLSNGVGFDLRSGF